jgi:formylglycine-generating enzyme required for sulfatase activity/DNA-binding winged helix-turn-helix (wHTH) protein/dienelactone hydrolase/predicted Ser/Thr protein kinase
VNLATPRLLRFGPFELDVRAGEIRKHGVRIRVQDQSFQILLMLMEHPGEVVLREEIRQKLWPNNTVVEFDHSINAAVKRLRNALGESADDPRYIETLARRGYRFLGEVKRSGAGSPAEVAESHIGADAAPDDLGGSTISHYRVLGKLGSGGMGEVWRAHDPRLNRDVAIKISAQHFTDRFEREARTIGALNHPNICSVYDVGPNYLVMELIEGPTLADRIAQGPIPIEEALCIANQIADALEAAHKKGIMHRDLKPGNIMVTGEGRIKLLDFGQALQTESQSSTVAAEGEVSGTVGYMSPEQVRGLPVDHMTDIFSFGVVLYEMVTGERPFTGSSAMAVREAVLHAQPRDFGECLVPGRLKAIIRKVLEKDPANRYLSAEVVLRELKELQASMTPAASVRLSRNAWIGVGAAAVLAGILAGWIWHNVSRQRWALETATPEIARLVDAGEYVKAAALAREARAVLPEDPAIEKLRMRATGEVSINGVPSGADVSIRSYRGDPNVWESLGKTPLQRIRVPLDAYVWRFVKPGFAPSFFIGEFVAVPLPGGHYNLDLTFKLRPEGSVPPDMVAVPGRIVALRYPTEQAPSVSIGDFLIDRHEVTNEQYKKFVDAGGYTRREFWKEPFVRDGKTISWEEAMASFHDGTGRPGPATWEAGSYPNGMEQHPVAGVGWYEAAAYAEFVGKSLPTAYHWTRASQTVTATAVIAAGGNFGSQGTQPVGSSAALSGYGTTDMAGNVKEWCLNEGREGRRFILGGGFGEPEYMFNHTDQQSPWDRRANFGFRCVKLDSPPSTAAAARIEVTTRDYRKEKPVSDDVFKAYTGLYAYDKGELNAKVEATASMPAWSRVKVTFDAAYGQERVIAYLFLPKSAPPPFQTVVYSPGASAYFDDKLDLSGVEDSLDFLLKSGRALMVPIYKGMYERRDGLPSDLQPPAFFRDQATAWVKDLGRSLDYLEKRKDTDAAKVAYMGYSAGAAQGLIMPTVEKRIKAAILLSGGFQLTVKYLPEADPFNFVPHLTIPVLMLNGRYDSTFPLESSQRPLFSFLGTPAKDKREVIYEGGHGAFPRPGAVRECLDWLDKYLGPVRH